MNAYEKKLKRLAEAYECGIKTLNKVEFSLLKNSKYKNLLKEDEYKPRFEKLLENARTGEKTEFRPFFKKNRFGHSKRLNISIARHIVQDLIDDLEERFDVGVENQDLDKYEKLSLTDVRDFIKYYCAKKRKAHRLTFDRIQKAAENARSLTSLMLELEAMTL